MASITLDMVVNETEPATAQAAIDEFKQELLVIRRWTEEEIAELTFEPVTDNGPGGGWPVVRVTGDDRAMRDMLLVYTGGDEDEADYLLNG
jgi:hypothetical protein